MQIIVTGLSTIEDPKPNKRGDMIVAFFDFRADFVTMKGASLVLLQSGGITTWEPLAKDDRLPRRSVQMTGEVRQRVASVAMQHFRQFRSLAFD